MLDRLAWSERAGVWIWLLSGICAAAVVFGLLGQDDGQAGLHALGMVFAGSVMGMSCVARRVGLASILVMAWGLGFGTWFPLWSGTAGDLCALWSAQLGVLSADLASELRVSMAIAGAGAATAVLLYLPTGSGRVVFQTLLLSLVAAVTPVLPQHERTALLVATLAWHVGVSGSLCRWAVEQVRHGSGLACAACGARLDGITSFTCPSCGKKLSARTAVVTASGRAGGREVAMGRWY